MNRIDKKFLKLKSNKKKAFVVYLTAGYPDIRTTEKLVLELSKIGVDIFELGIPFSDPLADGPVIQESSQYALEHKINLDKILSLVKRLRNKIDNPILAMGYYNPILSYGLERFAKNAKQSGLDGVIIPDLAIEEAKELKNFLNRNKLYLINFIAPTTDTERIKKITKLSKGFIYYVSLTGVTGARSNLPRGILEKVKHLKKYTKVPVCVGFGISNREQFKAISSFSDGVIVGSAVIKKIKDNINKKSLVSQVAKFIQSVNPR